MYFTNIICTPTNDDFLIELEAEHCGQLYKAEPFLFSNMNEVAIEFTQCTNQSVKFAIMNCYGNWSFVRAEKYRFFTVNMDRVMYAVTKIIEDEIEKCYQ